MPIAFFLFVIVRSHKFLLCLSMLIFLAAAQARADDDDAPLQTTADKTDIAATPSLHLTEAIQTLAGIQVAPVQNAEFQTEFQASASVLDLQPLLQLREQYFAAQAEYQSAQAGVKAAEQGIRRVRELLQAGANSERQWQEQQMQFNVSNAKLSSSQTRLQALDDQLLSQWGEPISSWVKSATHAEMRALISTQKVLLLLSLPANQPLPASIKSIAMAPDGNRQQTQTAQFIASAPLGSQLVQGETYFFSSVRHKLRTGMHLTAWINAAGNKLAGFHVPTSALLWHGGHAVLYFKTGAETFARFKVEQYFPHNQGYFIVGSYPANSGVVTVGAQLLLSQEFRHTLQAEEDGD